MVYCGKPSKACGECRARRTKCDYKKPSCSQCTRAKRICKGYRDASDTMFRDESENVVLAHRFPKNPSKQKPSSLGSSTPNHPVPTSVAPIASLSSTRRTAIPVLSINPCSSSEDHAVCYFFQNYIFGEDNVASGSFQFLPDVLLDNEINEVLSDSLTAVGLVGLAHFYHDPSLMFTAVYKYNSAMRTLSLQLRDIGKAKSDQYFMAIMLLGLYELNTCHNQMSMETWTKHIDGAAALMQMRGKQRPQTPLGCHLFKQLRAQVIKCIHRQTSVPPFIAEWSHASDLETTQQDFHTTLSLLVIRYANLRASMSSSKDYSDPERIISIAYALECDFASWVKSVPLEFIYQTITLSERVDEVYSDHYHVYSRIRVATTWNHYRCARLLTNEIILDQLSHLYEANPASPLLTTQSYYSEQQILESNAMLRHLCEDICASVPYYLGFPYNTGPGSVRQLPKALHANLIIWPLFAAGGSSLISDLMKNWVSERLQWIADVMGIRQAAPQAALLRGERSLLNLNSNRKLDDTLVPDINDPEVVSPPVQKFVFLEYNKNRTPSLSSL